VSLPHFPWYAGFAPDSLHLPLNWRADRPSGRLTPTGTSAVQLTAAFLPALHCPEQSRMPAPPTGEFAFIDWLRRRTPAADRVLLGPGDDTALLEWPGGPACLVTTDMLLEGSCFNLAEAGPRRVGRKAMAVNLSDIAAMAGVPVAAVVSVGLPRQGGRALAEELYLGLREVADDFQTAVVGGDTNSWDGPLVISVTIL